MKRFVQLLLWLSLLVWSYQLVSDELGDESDFKIHLQDERGFIKEGHVLPLYLVDTEWDGLNELPDSEHYNFSLVLNNTDDLSNKLGHFVFEFGRDGDDDFSDFLEFRDGQGRLIENGDSLDAAEINDFTLRAASLPEDSHLVRVVTISYYPDAALGDSEVPAFRLVIPFLVTELALNITTFPYFQVRSDINGLEDPSIPASAWLLVREWEVALQAAPPDTRLHWSEAEEGQGLRFDQKKTKTNEEGYSSNEVILPPLAGERHRFAVSLEKIKSRSWDWNKQDYSEGKFYHFNQPIVWFSHGIEVTPGRGADFDLSLSEDSLRSDSHGVVDLEISNLRDLHGNLVEAGEWVDIETLDFSTNLLWESFDFSDYELEEFYELSLPQVDEDGKLKRSFRVSHRVGEEEFAVRSAYGEKTISLPIYAVESHLESDQESLDIALQEQAKLTATFIGVDGKPVTDGTPVYVGCSAGTILNEQGERFDLRQGLKTKDGQVKFILDSTGADLNDQEDSGALVVAHLKNIEPAMKRIKLTQSVGLNFRFEDRHQILAGDKTEDGITIFRYADGSQVEIKYYAEIPVEIIGEPNSVIEVKQGQMIPLFHYACDELGPSNEVYDQCERHDAQGYGITLSEEAAPWSEGCVYFDGSAGIEVPHSASWQVENMFHYDLYIKPEERSGHILRQYKSIELFFHHHLLTLRINTDQGTKEITARKKIAFDRWTRIRCGITKDTLTLEVNGKQEKLDLEGATLESSSHPLTIGRDYQGLIDEIILRQYQSPSANSEWMEIRGLDSNDQIMLDGNGHGNISIHSTGKMFEKEDVGTKAQKRQVPIRHFFIEARKLDESYGPGDDEEDPLEATTAHVMEMGSDFMGAMAGYLAKMWPKGDTDHDDKVDSGDALNLVTSIYYQPEIRMTEDIVFMLSGYDSIQDVMYLSDKIYRGEQLATMDKIIAVLLFLEATLGSTTVHSALQAVARRLAKIPGGGWIDVFGGYIARWGERLKNMAAAGNRQELAEELERGGNLFRAMEDMAEHELTWLTKQLESTKDWEYVAAMCGHVGRARFLEFVQTAAHYNNSEVTKKLHTQVLEVVMKSDETALVQMQNAQGFKRATDSLYDYFHHGYGSRLELYEGHLNIDQYLKDGPATQLRAAFGEAQKADVDMGDMIIHIDQLYERIRENKTVIDIDEMLELPQNQWQGSAEEILSTLTFMSNQRRRNPTELHFVQHKIYPEDSSASNLYGFTVFPETVLGESHRFIYIRNLEVMEKVFGDASAETVGRELMDLVRQGEHDGNLKFLVDHGQKARFAELLNNHPEYSEEEIKKIMDTFFEVSDANIKWWD